MNVPGHGPSVIVTINAPATAGISRFSMRGEGGATADEARLLVRDMIHAEPVLPVPIRLWRQGFKKPFGCRSSILSRQHFLPSKLLCFLCHNGKGKAGTAIILIDSLVGVCTARMPVLAASGHVFPRSDQWPEVFVAFGKVWLTIWAHGLWEWQPAVCIARSWIRRRCPNYPRCAGRASGEALATRKSEFDPICGDAARFAGAFRPVFGTRRTGRRSTVARLWRTDCGR